MTHKTLKKNPENRSEGECRTESESAESAKIKKITEKWKFCCIGGRRESIWLLSYYEFEHSTCTMKYHHLY